MAHLFGTQPQGGRPNLSKSDAIRKSSVPVSGVKLDKATGER